MNLAVENHQSTGRVYSKQEVREAEKALNGLKKDVRTFLKGNFAKRVRDGAQAFKDGNADHKDQNPDYKGLVRLSNYLDKVEARLEFFLRDSIDPATIVNELIPSSRRHQLVDKLLSRDAGVEIASAGRFFVSNGDRKLGTELLKTFRVLSDIKQAQEFDFSALKNRRREPQLTQDDRGKIGSDIEQFDESANSLRGTLEWLTTTNELRKRTFGQTCALLVSNLRSRAEADRAFAAKLNQNGHTGLQQAISPKEKKLALEDMQAAQTHFNFSESGDRLASEIETDLLDVPRLEELARGYLKRVEGASNREVISDAAIELVDELNSYMFEARLVTTQGINPVKSILRSIKRSASVLESVPRPTFIERLKTGFSGIFSYFQAKKSVPKIESTPERRETVSLRDLQEPESAAPIDVYDLSGFTFDDEAHISVEPDSSGEQRTGAAAEVKARPGFSNGSMQLGQTAILGTRELTADEVAEPSGLPDDQTAELMPAVGEGNLTGDQFNADIEEQVAGAPIDEQVEIKEDVPISEVEGSVANESPSGLTHELVPDEQLEEEVADQFDQDSRVFTANVSEEILGEYNNRETIETELEAEIENEVLVSDVELDEPPIIEELVDSFESADLAESNEDDISVTETVNEGVVADSFSEETNEPAFKGEIVEEAVNLVQEASQHMLTSNIGQAANEGIDAAEAIGLDTVSLPTVSKADLTDMSALKKALFLASQPFPGSRDSLDRAYRNCCAELGSVEDEIDRSVVSGEPTFENSEVAIAAAAQIDEMQQMIREQLAGERIQVTEELRREASVVIDAGLPMHEEIEKYFSFSELKRRALIHATTTNGGEALADSSKRENVERFEFENGHVSFHDDNLINLRVGNTRLVIRDLKNGRVKIRSYESGEILRDKTGKLASYSAEKLIKLVLDGKGLDRLHKAAQDDTPDEVYIPPADIAERLERGEAII